MPPSALACPEDPDERLRRAYEDLRRDCQTVVRQRLLQLREALHDEGLI